MFYHFEPWPNFKLSSTQITSYFTISILKSLDFVPLDINMYIYIQVLSQPLRISSLLIWLFQKRHWRRYEVAKVGGLAIEVTNGPFVSEYSNISIFLETQTTIFYWMEMVKQPFATQRWGSPSNWNNHLKLDVPGSRYILKYSVTCGFGSKKHRNFLRISEDMLRYPMRYPGVATPLLPA